VANPKKKLQETNLKSLLTELINKKVKPASTVIEHCSLLIRFIITPIKLKSTVFKYLLIINEHERISSESKSVVNEPKCEANEYANQKNRLRIRSDLFRRFEVKGS